MTKILSAISLVLIIALLLPGCVAVNFTSTRTITGEGDIVAKTYTRQETGDFVKLNIEIPCTLYLSTGEPDVRIEAYENQFELIKVDNDDGELSIYTDGAEFYGSREFNDDSPKVYVSAPTLEQLAIYSAAHVAEAGKIVSEDFRFYINGAISGALDLEVRYLEIYCSGAADLELNGTADKASIENAGAGSINAYGLETTDAEVTVNGVGAVEITCTGTLDAEVNGVGSISHRGGAQVTESMNGLGSISEG